MKNISRREACRLLGGSITFGFCWFGLLHRESIGGILSGTQETTQKQWLDELFSGKPPVGGLHLYRFPDEVYGLTKPIGWIPPKESAEELPKVDVPVGFITDFASIPRIFWSILPRDGIYTYPAIIHDYLYWEQPFLRPTADEIFRIGMEEFDVSDTSVKAIYWSVVAGGGFAWDTNAKLKEKGEKRVVSKFPNDPLVKWADWKNDPSNFE
jgi:hypothetical protein